MSQPENKKPQTEKQEKNVLRPFNTENCDVRTQLIFEEWATVPCLKILTLLLARKGKSIFSAQGIGEMLNIPRSTVIHSLKLLRENEYIVREGGHYYLNVGVISDQPIGQPTNPLVRPTNPLVTVDQPIGQTPTNPLVTNNDKEIIEKNNDKVNEGDPPPRELTKLEKVVKESLVPENDPNLQTDNRFILAGRRPLKSYPLIWLTEQELLTTLKLYNDSGVPVDNKKVFTQAFHSVEARLRTYLGDGKKISNISCANWLQSWAFHDLLDSLKKSSDLKRSNLFLSNARSR